jgi:hypothetical protein
MDTLDEIRGVKGRRAAEEELESISKSKQESDQKKGNILFQILM